MTKQRYFSMLSGEFEGVYQLEPIAVLTTDGTAFFCPCCHGKITPVMDLIQWGFWEDKYQTFWVCQPCIKAFVYEYVLVCEVTEVKSHA